MSDEFFCAGCQRDEDNTSAESWCSDCEEPVCNTCAKCHKKMSSPHAIIPIEEAQFLSSTLFQQSRICEYHPDKKIVLFCSVHDCVLCDSCMSETHQSCKPIISIEKAAKGFKSGVTAFDLEKRMDNMYQVIANILGDQIRYKEEFHISRKDISTKISDIKTRVIAHINQLEDTFIKDLDKQYIEHEDIFIEGERNLQSMLESVSSSHNDFKSLKSHATEKLLFQAVKYLDAKICQQEMEIRKIQNSSFPRLKFQTQKPFLNMMKSFPSIGTVTIGKVPSMQLSAGLDIDKQGQSIARPKIDQKRLCLFSSFTIPDMDVCVLVLSGCVIPGNRLLLASYYEKVYVCDFDGSNFRSIELQYNPCAVASYDKNTALISSHRRFFQTIDLDTLVLGSNIRVGLACKEITSVNGNICVRDRDRSLSLVDIGGVKRGQISTTSDPLYISMNKSSEIYYLADNDNKIFVTTSEGKERVFYDSPDFKDLTGIAVGEENDVYVSSGKSNAIYRIFRDGQKHDIVLNEGDGIENPSGLSYCDLTKELMVLNESGKFIQIYKIQ